ncbi:MAG: hypothetical protein JRI25_20925, partial [Deltaproteobacteria bacterium]|nr:hypothetical protein [Deltaproteobacteria bacterium]
DSDSDSDSDTDTGSCPDDPQENNDVFGDAWEVLPTASVSGQICAADDDWYWVGVGDNCVVDVDLSFTHTLGDLDVYLWDSGEALLDLSWSTTDDEYISYISGTAQDLYLQVVGYLDAENSYDLQVMATCESSPFECPADDLFEENDSLQDARWLNVLHTTLDGVVCDYDEDWYALVALDGCMAVVTLTHTYDDGDLDLTLTDDEGNILAYGWSITDDEAITYHFDNDGVYALLVDGWAGATNDYTLNVDVSCPTGDPLTCPADDMHEENDDSVAGVPLNPVFTLIDGIVCPDDEDWFTVPVSLGCTLEAELDFDPSEGDLDLQLFDSLGYLVGLSASVDSTEYESWHADIDGTVYVAAYGYGSDTAEYRLLTYVSCPPDVLLTCATDDFYEENDLSSDAESLNFEFTSLRAIGCDDDWFAGEVYDGCWFQALALFTDDPGDDYDDLDLDLLDSLGYVLDIGWSTTDDEYVSHIAYASDIVFLDVYPVPSAAENLYDLNTLILCPTSEDLTCPTDDIFEPNDLDTEATALNWDFTSLEGTVCAENSDWYWVYALTGCTLDVDLFFTHAADGDLDLDLHDSDGWLVTVDSSTDDESIDWVAGSDDIYWVEVYGFDSADENVYGLDVWVDCP